MEKVGDTRRSYQGDPRDIKGPRGEPRCHLASIQKPCDDFRPRARGASDRAVGQGAPGGDPENAVIWGAQYVPPKMCEPKTQLFL